jgi:hypothetical protein
LQLSPNNLTTIKKQLNQNKKEDDSTKRAFEKKKERAKKVSRKINFLFD